MVTLEEFNSLVRQNYYFLEDHYEFKYSGADQTNRMLYVYYVRDDLHVCIEYSHVNVYTEPVVFKGKPVDREFKFYGLPSISLSWLLIDSVIFGPEFDYKSIMPNEIPLEDSVRTTAELFQKVGDPILSGNDWYSWEDLSRKRKAN